MEGQDRPRRPPVARGTYFTPQALAVRLPDPHIYSTRETLRSGRWLCFRHGCKEEGDAEVEAAFFCSSFFLGHFRFHFTLFFSSRGKGRPTLTVGRRMALRTKMAGWGFQSCIQRITAAMIHSGPHSRTNISDYTSRERGPGRGYQLLTGLWHTETADYLCNSVHRRRVLVVPPGKEAERRPRRAGGERTMEPPRERSPPLFFLLSKGVNVHSGRMKLDNIISQCIGTTMGSTSGVLSDGEVRDAGEMVSAAVERAVL